MLRQRVFLPLLGAAAGGLLGVAVVPMTVAHADDCTLGACTLVSGGSPTDVFYTGFRPLFTEWNSNQPVNVDVTQAGSSAVSGSYNVAEQDYGTPISHVGIYEYDNFTPAAGNASGIDSDGLSGATVYDFQFFPETAGTASGQPDFAINHEIVMGPSGTDMMVTTADGYKNVFEWTGIAAADWIQLPGQTHLTELFNELYNPGLPVVPDVLPPDLWFVNDFSPA